MNNNFINSKESVKPDIQERHKAKNNIRTAIRKMILGLIVLCILFFQTGCIAMAASAMLIAVAAMSNTDSGKTTTQPPNNQDTETNKRATATKIVDKNTKITMLPGNIPLMLRKVESGSLQMGSKIVEDSSLENATDHLITMKNDYWIGKYEITQEQYLAVMGVNPSEYKKIGGYPVEQVSWDEAMIFCKKLNELLGNELPEGYEFNLPTEVQWEYAAHGGMTSRSYLYSGSNDCETVAWYSENTNGATCLVGYKSPNELGIYDMSGNVAEWCRDVYEANPECSQNTIENSENGSERVHRGGSWGSSQEGCRVIFRYCNSSSLHDSTIGFRVALVPKE